MALKAGGKARVSSPAGFGQGDGAISANEELKILDIVDAGTPGIGLVGGPSVLLSHTYLADNGAGEQVETERVLSVSLAVFEQVFKEVGN